MTDAHRPADEQATVAGRRWLPGLEALRGIAAATVVVHHSWSLSTMPRFPGYWVIEGFGSLGVNLFFLLSGYLLADTFWRPKEPGRLRTYWIRRIFRIAPAYYVTVGLLFVFFAEHALLFSRQGARQILANATFSHYLFPGTSSSLNVDGALWTMTAEFLLYLALPLMALPFLRAPRTAFATLVLLGLGWRLLVALGGDSLREVYFSATGPGAGIESLYLARQFIGLLPIFALGIGLKWLQFSGHLHGLRDHLPHRMNLLALVASLSPPVLLLYFVERASNYDHWIWFTGYDFVMSTLLVPAIVLASQPTWIPTKLAHRAAVWVGDRSYSLYIWHFPIVLSVYGRGPLVAPPDVSYIWLRLALIGVLSLVAAHLSFTFIEKPGMAYGKRLAAMLSARRSDTASPSGGSVVPAARVV
ncbi:MAG: acyltransferase [Phycicoccus sp.]|nr:acyltransferase [Phycicoccus sp.]